MIVMKTASNFQYMKEITTTFVRVDDARPDTVGRDVPAVVPHPAPDVPAGSAGNVAIMSPVEGTPVSLRTQRWYDGSSRDNYIHRSWMKRGLPDDVFTGKPMIGICNSASELTPCNQHLGDLAEHVKRGVWEAGGVPLEFPVTSLGETLIQPTAMLLRNLMAMDVEESLRGNPLDGVVLLVGLRQDDAGDADGRRVGRPPGDHADRWADAHRPSPRQAPRLGDRHVADERGRPRRH